MTIPGHSKIGFGRDMVVALNNLDKIEKSDNEEEMEGPIKTIEKVLNFFADIDLEY